jgi:hypothetical protein
MMLNPYRYSPDWLVSGAIEKLVLNPDAFLDLIRLSRSRCLSYSTVLLLKADDTMLFHRNISPFINKMSTIIQRALNDL